MPISDKVVNPIVEPIHNNPNDPHAVYKIPYVIPKATGHFTVFFVLTDSLRTDCGSSLVGSTFIGGSSQLPRASIFLTTFPLYSDGTAQTRIGTLLYQDQSTTIPTNTASPPTTVLVGTRRYNIILDSGVQVSFDLLFNGPNPAFNLGDNYTSRITYATGTDHGHNLVSVTGVVTLSILANGGRQLVVSYK